MVCGEAAPMIASGTRAGVKPCNTGVAGREAVTTTAQWWVYMLRCADGSLYTGITTDVLRRWREHNESPRGARYTRARRPVRLVLCVPVPSRAVAGRLEATLKALPRARKERLLASAVPAVIAKPIGNGLTAANLRTETL